MTTPSFRSRAVAAGANLALRPLAEILPANLLGVRVSRLVVASSMLVGDPPPYRTRIRSIRTATVRGEWVHPTSTSRNLQMAQRSRQIVLYVHGSGYAICSARTHRGVTSRLARYTGLPVFVVDYRLAPEYPFPAAADDVRAAWEWLIDIGYRPENIVLAGDSAGGHLILDLVAQNSAERAPQPAAVALMSPLLDLTMSLATDHERAQRDPLISAAAAGRLVRHYTRGQPDDLPRLRLRLERGPGIPPFLIQVGGTEMLQADAAAMTRMLRDAGAPCELQTWPGQIHVFQALPRLIPEAEPALRRLAEFVVQHAVAASDTGVPEHQERTS